MTNSEEKAASDYVYELARSTWGDHPISWPHPPRSKPRWWQFRERKRLAQMEYVFGVLDAAALRRYWYEVRKGQSVYEDAGGYMLRCYQAMMGYPVDEPYTYSRATADLLQNGAL